MSEATKPRRRKRVRVRRLIPAGEFADVLGISKRTVIRRLETGVFDGVQDGNWFVKRSFCVAYCTKLGIEFHEDDSDLDDIG